MNHLDARMDIRREEERKRQSEAAKSREMLKWQRAREAEEAAAEAAKAREEEVAAKRYQEEQAELARVRALEVEVQVLRAKVVADQSLSVPESPRYLADMLDTATAARMLSLKDRIEQHFDASNWADVGLMTGFPDVIHNHRRLLRSLSWHDEDYGANIAEVLQDLHGKNSEFLDRIEGYLVKKYPDAATGESISSAPADRKLTFCPLIFKIPEKSVEPDFVSVMMPFAVNFSKVYEAMQGACADSGFRCDRADNVWEHETVIQDIFELIFRARIVICDFSGKNPNVMYETGLAHALGKHVIPISQSLDDVPFDLKHHRVLIYLNNGEGLRELQKGLAKKLAGMKV